MANKKQFINNIIVVAPRHSVVTIKPPSLSTSITLLRTPACSSRTYNKQSNSKTTSLAYEYASNKDRYKIEYKKRTTSETIIRKEVPVKPSNRTSSIISSSSSSKQMSMSYKKKIGTRECSTLSAVKASSSNYIGKGGYQKNEHKSSSTVRIMDKGGYTEYYKEERVTRVNYGNYNKSGTGGKIGCSKAYNKSGGANK